MTAVTPDTTMSSAKRVNRLDLSRVDASGVVETGSGGLRIPARVTRTGVLEYHDTEGNTWGELRPADEVFSEDSLVTLKSAPVTQGHPGNLVTPDTWKRLAVGHAGDDVRRDGEFVAVSVCVQDAATLELVRSKELVELSCGYSCDLDETAGTFEGKPYTRIQRGIRYNHVALGPEGWGRAGSDVRLHLDSNTALSDSVPRAQTVDTTDTIDSTAGDSARNQTGKLMTIKNMRKDGEPIEEKKGAAEEKPMDAEEMIPKSKYDADLAAVNAAFEALKTALGDAMTKLASLEAAHKAEEAAEGEVTEEMVPPAVQDSIASKRLALLDTARAVVGDSADFAGKSAAEIKRMVVSKAFPSVKLDAKSSPETVETLYTAATEQHRATAEAAKRADAKRADANEKISKVLAPDAKQAEEVKRQDSAADEDPIAEQQRRLKALSEPKNSNTSAHGRA